VADKAFMAAIPILADWVFVLLSFWGFDARSFFNLARGTSFFFGMHVCRGVGGL
jgi:hypothetical protein